MALWELFALVAASLMLAQTTGAPTEGRPKVITTEYRSISLSTLLSVYKRCYVDAGFTLKETKRTVTDLGTQNVTRLVFQIANREYPRKKKGIASFLIVSRHGTKRCAPCSAHAETIGVIADAAEYDLEQYGRFMTAIIEADRRAQAAIRAAMEELGASVFSEGRSSDICSRHADAAPTAG